MAGSSVCQWTSGQYHSYPFKSTPYDTNVQSEADFIFEDVEASAGNYYPPFNTDHFGTAGNGVNQVDGYTNYSNPNTWSNWPLNQSVVTTVVLNNESTGQRYATPTSLNYASEFNVCPGYGPCS